jgi:hypothetical protein
MYVRFNYVSGINLWIEYRLAEEGIENVQNLATADPITLAIHTHYNVRTLVDWIDQALLLHRLRARGKLLLEKNIAGTSDE